jgi:hypothetical protein
MVFMTAPSDVSTRRHRCRRATVKDPPDRAARHRQRHANRVRESRRHVGGQDRARDRRSRLGARGRAVVRRIDAHTVVEAWAYNGQVPGPVIRVHMDDHVRIVFTNHLPEQTTIHWHGIDVPND